MPQPVEAPPSPRAVTATRRGSRVVVTWNPATEATATTTYRVLTEPATKVVGPTRSTTATLTGLPSDQGYDVLVEAIDGDRVSAPATVEVPASTGIWGATARLAAGVLAVAAIVAAVVIISVGPLRPRRTAFTLGGLGVLTFVLLLAAAGQLRSAIVGGDGRLSTSKAQVALWTLAIGFGLLVCVGYSWAGEVPLETMMEESLAPEYLLLLGGPFVGLIGARAIVSHQLETQTRQKTEADRARLVDLVADDDGNIDLVDAQYLLFTGVALVYFLVQVIANPADGLPAMPLSLVGLTSASALTYLGNKVTDRSPAAITSVRPREAQPGDEVTIRGTNLVPPGGDTVDVLLDERFPLDVTRKSRDSVVVVVPLDAPEGDTELHLRTAGGVEAAAPITVRRTPAIDGVVPAVCVAGDVVTIVGRRLRGFRDRLGRVTVTFTAGEHHVPVGVEPSAQDELTVTVPEELSGPTTVIVHPAGEQPSAPYRLEIRPAFQRQLGPPTIEEEEPPVDQPAGFYEGDRPDAGPPDEEAELVEVPAAAPDAIPAVQP